MASRLDSDEIAEFGPFRFERAAGFLYRNDEEVPLPPRAAAVLDRLLREPGALVSKDDLLESAWADTEVTEYSLVEAVKVIRRALDDEGSERRYVQTIHGRGYRFVAPVRFVPAARSPTRPGAARDRSTESAVRLVRQLGGAIMKAALRSRFALGLLVVGLALGGLAGWLVARRGGARSHGLGTGSSLHLALSLPAGAPLALGAGNPLALSRDGELLAYVAAETSQVRRIYLLRLDRPGAVPLRGTEQAWGPTFSPDGAWLAFFAGGGNEPLVLKKTSLESGETVTLATAGRVPGGAYWGTDGFIYFTPDDGQGIHRVPEQGGTPQAITTPQVGSGSGQEDSTHRWPQLLDGHRLLFTVVHRGVARSADTRVVVGDLDGGEETTIVDGAGFARVLPGNLLVFARDGDLWASEIDPRDPAVHGAETRILTDVDPRQLALSDSGTLVYDSIDMMARVRWFDRSGNASPVPGATEGCFYPSLGPDDGKIALTCRAGNGFAIMLLDAVRGTRTRLTFAGDDAVAIWTPSGDRVVYSTFHDGEWQLVSRGAGGEGDATTLLTSEVPVYPQDVSPDGKELILQRVSTDSGEGIWRMPVAGGAPEPLVDTRFHESGARLSPDGRWLAYHSNEADGWHVYAFALDGSSGKIRVSTRGGGWPVWTRDGDELLYITNRSEALMSVPFDGSSFGIPRALFAASDMARDRRGPVFDVTHDGSRIVATTVRPTTDAARVYLLWNWLDGVRAKLADRD